MQIAMNNSALSRRQLLAQAGGGAGLLALAALLADQGLLVAGAAPRKALPAVRRPIRGSIRWRPRRATFRPRPRASSGCS